MHVGEQNHKGRPANYTVFSNVHCMADKRSTCLASQSRTTSHCSMASYRPMQATKLATQVDDVHMMSLKSHRLPCRTVASNLIQSFSGSVEPSVYGNFAETTRTRVSLYTTCLRQTSEHGHVAILRLSLPMLN